MNDINRCLFSVLYIFESNLGLSLYQNLIALHCFFVKFTAINEIFGFVIEYIGLREFIRSIYPVIDTLEVLPELAITERKEREKKCGLKSKTRRENRSSFWRCLVENSLLVAIRELYIYIYIYPRDSKVGI